ncbi:MAG: tungsten formylmethanofuran dehydrogenase [Deltaproteobacteria bacterium]|nr:tungsten formylmethanofuran dehydrogenase [Deltaproteobacteria bacterium]
MMTTTTSQTTTSSKTKNGKRTAVRKNTSKKTSSTLLSAEVQLDAYKQMKTSALLDHKQLVLLKQGKGYFHIGCRGHEAIQTATAIVLEQKKDWAYPYYRGQSLSMGMGMTPYELLLSFLAKADDPNSGGRQMPQHYGHKDLNIPSQSSPTGTQYLQAVGCALASKWNVDHAASKKKSKENYEVTVVTSGEGTTSQGDLHEALSWAAREKAPVVFLIEDNGYAISVPKTVQTPDGKIENIGKGYAGLEVFTVDGCNLQASHDVMLQAITRARKGEGPSFVVADVVRLLPHSSSDDQRKYRPADDLAVDVKRDPVVALRAKLIKDKVLSKKKADDLDVELKALVDSEAERAGKAAMPARSTAEDWVLSGDPEPALTEPETEDEDTVLVDAINRALSEELARNDKMVIFGEDIAGEKGGVFTATRGLTKKFGSERVFNSSLAESSIVGVAIGLAMRGYKPVPEIQFGDYVWTAMMQLRNELSTMRYRSNNQFNCPAVIRIPIGGYIHGALCHSQNIESFFAHIPGLKICLPSTAGDAYGLLKAAIRGNDPVLFLEHKGLYRQNFAKSQLPKGDDWVLPFGKASIRRGGEDLTIVAYGAMVQRSLQAASVLEDEGFDIEIIDLRSLNPVDWDTCVTSVKKTGKCLVIHEDMRFVGYGAEIAAELSERCFEHLDGPIRRLAAKDTPVPYNWDLEEEILPQMHHITTSMRELLKY